MSAVPSVPIRHLVLLQFKSSASPDSIASVLHHASTFQSSIPDVLYYGVHSVIPAERTPAGHMTNPAGFTHVLDGLFPSVHAYHVYEEHEAHTGLKQRLAPLVQRVLVVDQEMAGLDVPAFLAAQRPPHVHHLTLIRPNSGVERAQINPTLQKWGTLPSSVPELVWASTGFASDTPLYPGWMDASDGYSVVSDMMGRDLASMPAYTQHPAHLQLAPTVMQITNVELGGLIAVDWQL